MKNLISALILVASSMVAGQRPSFAGLSPIGFPILENRTTTTPDPLGNRFGEGNTLPIEANGDWDLVDRLSKLPIDKQPFWFINWQAYDKHRKEPQTYPQRPSAFAEAVPVNTNNAQANTQVSTQPNPGFVTTVPNVLYNRFDPTTSSSQPNSNFNNNFNRTQTVDSITTIYPTSNVYPNTNSNTYPNSNSNTNSYPNSNSNTNTYPNSNSNSNAFPNSNANVYPNTNTNVYPNSNTNSNAYPGINSNWNVQVNDNSNPNLLPNGNSNSNSFPNVNSNPNTNSNFYPGSNSNWNVKVNGSSNPNLLPNGNSNSNLFPNGNVNSNLYPNVNVTPNNYPAPNTNSNQFQTSNFNTNSNPVVVNRNGGHTQTTQKYQWTPTYNTTKVVPTNYNNNPQYNTRTDNYPQRSEYGF